MLLTGKLSCDVLVGELPWAADKRFERAEEAGVPHKAVVEVYLNECQYAWYFRRSGLSANVAVFSFEFRSAIQAMLVRKYEGLLFGGRVLFLLKFEHSL